ncbi:MAG: uracil-DNA glycosylase [Candidatus Thorarchaeota archaeon]
MKKAKNLRLLHDEIEGCTKCPLHETRTNAVPGEGPVDAKVMFIGEAPGAKEDETGRPFVGRSGKILIELIEGIGLSRDDIFITSILKSRPPKNRTPKRAEKEVCLPYLEKQIELINPKVIVLLGGVAISTLIGPWKLSDAHGSFYDGNGRTYFLTYHPAAALRFPKFKEVMKQDFTILKKKLE